MPSRIVYVVEYSTMPYPDPTRERDWRTRALLTNEQDALRALAGEIATDFLGHAYRLSVRVETEWVIMPAVKVDHHTPTGTTVTPLDTP